jgi:hypothetical protein
MIMTKKPSSRKYGAARRHRPRAQVPVIPKPTATAADFTRAMMGAERAGILPQSGVKR